MTAPSDEVLEQRSFTDGPVVHRDRTRTDGSAPRAYRIIPGLSLGRLRSKCSSRAVYAPAHDRAVLVVSLPDMVLGVHADVLPGDPDDHALHVAR